MNHLPEKMRPYRDLLEKSAKEYVKLNVRKEKTGRYDSKIAGDPYFPKHETYPTDENGQPMKLLAQIISRTFPSLTATLLQVSCSSTFLFMMTSMD